VEPDEPGATGDEKFQEKAETRKAES